MTLPLLEKEIAPQIAFDILEVRVALPGAGPAQIERTVSRKVEQALIGIEGIADISTEARKNISITYIEVSSKTPVAEVINKVRTRMDAIKGLPEEATRPIVSDFTVKEPAMLLALTGDTTLYSLNKVAENLVAEMHAIPGLSLVFIADAPTRQFLVEVSESDLQRYQINFAEIAKRIQGAVVDIAGATLSTDAGEITVVGESDVKSIEDLEDLTIRSTPDGARILLSDIASVQDSYQVNERYKKLDGKNVVYIAVNRGQGEDIVKLAEKVRQFVKENNGTLPSGISVEVIMDVSKQVTGRIELLSSNAISGFILVFIILLIYMNLRLAFWITWGIPISFMGGIVVLYFSGGTLNMVSLFGFILILGIVVDDAIVIGESIYSQHEKGVYGVKASIQGTWEVYNPVIFSVVTTMIAFVPMLFIPGEEGRLMLAIPFVVISVLAVSLFEALCILPAHLSTVKRKRSEAFPLINKVQVYVNNVTDKFLRERYSPFLEHVLYWRYAYFVGFFGIFFISVALLSFRWINVSMVSHIETDVLLARIEMIEDTPLEETRLAVQRLEQAAKEIQNEVNEDLGFEQIIHVASEIDNNSNTRGKVSIYLDTKEKRSIAGIEIENRLLTLFGDVPHVNSLRVKTSVFGDGAQIDLELAHNDVKKLESASQELRATLANYQGVKNVWDNFSQGSREVTFKLKPEAGDMGITTAQVAAQIRQAFHGDSVQIYDESNNRIPVLIEYPEEQRNSLWFLENLPIKLRDESTVPLNAVANFEYRDAPAIINLHNGKRTIRVKASLDGKLSNAQVMSALRKDFFSELSEKYPGMSWKVAGGQEKGYEVLEYMSVAFPLSLLVMYLLMATLFGSYSQPLMIMYAIPFGLVGALLGHLLMGIDFTLWSLIGIVAVSGVVVNDNLVMVDRINQLRASGTPLREAIRDTGVSRFRAIMLTSMTTFLGLSPIMLETSVQAQFLIPMACSLAFGVLFSTAITLILVPALYNILDDVQVLIAKQSLDTRFDQFIRKKMNSMD